MAETPPAETPPAGFVVHREARWYYAAEAIAHIEARNCAKGCAHGDPGNPLEPGGSCPVLIAVLLEEPAPQITDDGAELSCSDFAPVPAPTPVPPQADALFEVPQRDPAAPRPQSLPESLPPEPCPCAAPGHHGRPCARTAAASGCSCGSAHPERCAVCAHACQAPD